MDEFGILYYLNSYPVLSESFVLNEIHELDSRGYNVAVFAQRESNDAVTRSEVEQLDIQVFYGNIRKHHIWKFDPTNYLQSNLQVPLRQAKNHYSLKQQFRMMALGNMCIEAINQLDFQIDIIHGHFANKEKLGQIYASTYHQIPSVITAHAYEIFTATRKQYTPFLANYTDRFIVPSQYNKNYLINEFDVKIPIDYVPATTNISKFTPTTDIVPNRLLTVGRLVEKKGHRYALAAVSDIVEKGYDVEYHIVGDGQMMDELQQLTTKYNISSNVKFRGRVSDEELRRELSEAAVFLLPCVIAKNGDRDAMPVVLKEAMAAETACVSTTISGVPELITQNHNGLLTPPRDTAALVNAILELLEDDDKRERIAREGLTMVNQQFTISDSVDRLIRSYKRTIDMNKDRI